MPDAWQSAVFFFGGSETVGTPTPNPLARCWSGPTSVRSPSLVTCHSLERAMTSLWMNPAVDAAAERPAAATAGLRMAAGTPARAEIITKYLKIFTKRKLRHDSARVAIRSVG